MIYYFNPMTIVIGNTSAVNKYASGSLLNIDLGDFIDGEDIIRICAPPDSEAKFSRYYTLSLV
jgi:hypothetical protein